MNIAAGAQTERRGGAGPVRGLLGGKDLTGRFSLIRTWRTVFQTVLSGKDGLKNRPTIQVHQSDPGTSRPDGVTAAHQVSPLMLGANVVFADGSVRFLKADIDIRVFARLVTRAGGEVVAGNDY